MQKKLFTGLVFLLLLVNGASAEDPESAFNAANDIYSEGKFAEAIEAYKGLLAEGWTSADLLYNLGNAYWQTNAIGPAILHLERALLQAPNDPDIQYNLELVRRKLKDDISEIPEFFLSRWWRQMSLMANANVWSILGLLLIWCGIAGLTLWLLGKSRATRKRGFLLGVPLLILGLIPVFLAFNRIQLEQNSRFAILQIAETTLYSAPDEASQSVFDLHEGTKVEVLDKIGEWVKVRLLNGDQGWLPEKIMEQI